jgi:hypothetical protein
MAPIVKLLRRVIARFRTITLVYFRTQVAVGTMLAIFKSQESKDFEKAMDLLDCSRTLMSSAIETHRAIEECDSGDLVELLALIAVVKPANRFLQKNIEPVSKKITEWKLRMQQLEPCRYSKIERIINNAEKNLSVARKKLIDINYWIRFGRPCLLPVSSIAEHQ